MGHLRGRSRQRKAVVDLGLQPPPRDLDVALGYVVFHRSTEASTSKMTEQIIVPPHLVDKIRAVLVEDLKLPSDLQDELRTGLDRRVEGAEELKTEPRPLLDVSVIERLSRWAGSDDGISILEAHGIGTYLLFHTNTGRRIS